MSATPSDRESEIYLARYKPLFLEKHSGDLRTHCCITRYKGRVGELIPGALFAGYRIEGVVGRGGMGVVYRASESRPVRTVALKVVAPELAGDAGFRERFLHEAQIASSIEHPHVVPVLRVGEEEGRLFIAMRLIRGQDLAAMIRAAGRLEPLVAARLIDQVADALDVAHGQGVVHRDVKPANVLVERHRRGEHAYLTDFGLTKSFGSSAGMTSTGAVVGSTDYMAPEQWKGLRVDARTDVYSLGCVLFEALTGRVPFERDGPHARMYAHLSEPPPTVSSVVPECFRFDDLVCRAMAKEPAERYASAGDLGFAATTAAEDRRITHADWSLAKDNVASREDVTETIDARSEIKTAELAALSATGELPRTALHPMAKRRPIEYRASAAAAPPRATNRGLTAKRLVVIAGIIAIAGALVGILAAGGLFSSGSSTKGATSGSQGTVGTVSTKSLAPQPVATTPVSATESFYTLSASHHYSAAWAFADSNFRSQLHGYANFQALMSPVESIKFDSAHVVNQIGDTATVAIATTPTKTTGPDHCHGTANLLRAANSGWLLDRISITCI